MAVHRETLSEDVGGKLLLLASMLAVFGMIALLLMPLGAAFAPPPEVAATDVAAPEGPPAIVGAIMPGLVMLVVAAIVGACAGLLLGHARARAEEAAAAEDVPTPH